MLDQKNHQETNLKIQEALSKDFQLKKLSINFMKKNYRSRSISQHNKKRLNAHKRNKSHQTRRSKKSLKVMGKQCAAPLGIFSLWSEIKRPSQVQIEIEPRAISSVISLRPKTVGQRLRYESCQAKNFTPIADSDNFGLKINERIIDQTTQLRRLRTTYNKFRHGKINYPEEQFSIQMNEKIFLNNKRFTRRSSSQNNVNKSNSFKSAFQLSPLTTNSQTYNLKELIRSKISTAYQKIRRSVTPSQNRQNVIIKSKHNLFRSKPKRLFLIDQKYKQ